MAFPPHHSDLNQADSSSALDSLLLQAAGDPMTPPSDLADLATSPYAQVRSGVAKNPNTPLQTLHQLWLEFPLSSLENAALDIQTILTAKAFHELIPVPVQLKLYQSLMEAERIEEIDGLLPVEQRANWFAEQRTFASNFNRINHDLTGIGTYLPQDPSPRVRLVAIGTLDCRFLLPFSKSAILKERMAVAERILAFKPPKEHPQIPSFEEQLIETLAQDPDEKVRAVVAQAKAISPEAHLRLSQDASQRVRELLAKLESRNLTKQLAGWENLASQETEIARNVARNPCCPQSLRLKLTSHSDQTVRSAAWTKIQFDNPSIEGALTERLKTLFESLNAEEELCVLASYPSIAKYPALPETVASILATKSPAVTRALAANLTISDSLRIQLLSHPDPETAFRALLHGDSDPVLKAALPHPESRMRALLASKKGRLATRLRKVLAKDESTEVRGAVARHVVLALRHYNGADIQACLTTLAHDSAPNIRAIVAPDHRLSRADFKFLCSDPSSEVRLTLLKSRSTEFHGHLGLLKESALNVRKVAAEEALYADSDRKRYRVFIKRYAVDRVIARDSKATIRAIAAKYEGTSPEVLRRLLTDPSASVRIALLKREPIKTEPQFAAWAKLACPELTGRIIELTDHENPIFRAILARYPKAGIVRLTHFAKDPSWFVQACVSLNPNAPAALINVVLENADPHIRDFLASKLRESIRRTISP